VHLVGDLFELLNMLANVVSPCIIRGHKYNGERSIKTSMLPFYFVVAYFDNATDCVHYSSSNWGGGLYCELRMKCSKKRS
jgi:hypothetical protein